MRVIKSIVLLFLATLLVVSCSKDEDEEIFKGGVYVTLVNKGTSEIQEGEATKINYEVVLTKSFDKDIKLVFDLENLAQYPNLVSLPESVTISKNKTKGVFSITGIKKSDAENILKENTQFNLILKSSSGITSKVELDKDYSITVKKEEAFEILTEAQKVLIEGYKAKGIDLLKWIGKIPVSVKITTGSGGYHVFENSEDQNYSGVTYITLSDNATADKPLLKMVNNAFGLNEYLQWVFRNETIKNTGFWYTVDTTQPFYDEMPPAPTKVMKALGKDKYLKWKNKEYSFNVVVDNIEVTKDKVIFVRENNTYENEENFLTMEYESKPIDKTFAGVAFEYEFPLWDEFKKLAIGNADLTEQATYTGSIHPNYYIGETPILKNDWFNDGGTNWVKPTSSYTDTEMKFKFNSDHLSSGDYDIIEVTLTAK